MSNNQISPNIISRSAIDNPW